MSQQPYPTFKEEYKPLTKMMKIGAKGWEDARVILAEVAVDRNAVKQILPKYMSLTDEAKATLFIADYPKNLFTVPYKESAVLIHVKTPMGKGLHCVWMAVDDDTALIYGRESLGFPKKLADFMFEEEGTNIQAGIERRGKQLISMKGVIKERERNPLPAFGYKIFNVRHSTKFLFLHSIWMFKPGENFKESHLADIDLKIEKSEDDPIYRLISGSPINSRVVTVDILNGYYVLPVGLTTFKWYVMSHKLRYK